MAESKKKFSKRLHHRGTSLQVPIYLGKLFRSFVYQNDWKVLPMSAVIAALVSVVVRSGFCVTMEGTLKGALALTCVGIWNGCFNSIQSVCRERGIVKREHRSGMRIFSYISAHMIYQALLCLAQTVITLYVCSKIMGMRFPQEGLWSGHMIVEIGITIFLISYASDMLSLLVSCMVRSTTTAMTVMPFLLIFQLVFSGGIFTMPAWAESLSGLSISNYGLKCIAAQGNYNSLPMTTGWNVIDRMKNQEIAINTTGGEILELVTDPEGIPMKTFGDFRLTEDTTVKDALEILRTLPMAEEKKNAPVNLRVRIIDLIKSVGEDRVRTYVQQKTAEAAHTEAYELSKERVAGYWIHLILFILLFSFASVVSLSFIDRDKR